MKKLKSGMLVISFLLVLISGKSQGQQNFSPILFIYDASGSMWAQMEGKTRMEIAREVLSGSVQKLPVNQPIGLMVYGHRNKEDCRDVELLVEQKNTNKDKISSALESVRPLGMTPLAYSATLAFNEIRKTGTKTTIILITDGIETCGGNICDVVNQAKKEGIEFRLHIIGFGLKEGETKQLECAALAGDGYYYDAPDAGSLETILNETFTKTVDEPAGNVTVYAEKNGVAIDAVVKAYDQVAKRNPISVRTYRDTASFFLPPSTYNFEVTPLEGSDVQMITVSNIQSFENKIIHQDIFFDGGKIAVTTTNNNENWDCIVKVIDQDRKIAGSVRTYQAPKELEVNPGVYNISVEALALNGIETQVEIKNIAVVAGKTIPVSHNFKSGKIVVETLVSGKAIDCVVNVFEVSSGKNVAAGRTYGREKAFLLNPGKYEIKVLPLGVHNDKKQQVLTVDLVQGETLSETLNF
jgi:Ca-activated chloride channel family protein